ncbi:Cytochrome P450, family 81, subfamily D, polypeptide 2 [Hibiscus syriacus]|uniref:Cytochrome P450, family 81, subfamily D, polypeptide 2 n=1 Tax=Hibiscus syriacus TaxID=106335 RepID=A0A6A2WIX2_HIBSY|nr:Cytochrome P450, family 81, subfamily D, polypeptide 2 [Hibiscus syriacus]
MVVMSSSATAEECLVKNDIIFANRPKFINAKHLGYNYSTVISSYGDHWHNLRRIGATEIFSPARLSATINARKDEMRCLLNGGNEVEDEEEATEFRELMVEVAKKSGTGNPADYLLILNWSSLGFERELKKLAQRMVGFLQKLIDDHRSKKLQNNSMIHHLLSMQQSDPVYYTDEIIKGFIMVIILAGTDTSSVTIEWAMANLLNHPQVLKKARDEIDSLIGEENLIEESDVPKLHYIQSIMYETLGLYPAAPLLIPHTPSTDCTIGGYDVPSGAVVLVNAWAIHRDPKVWDDPESFKPERMDGKEIDMIEGKGSIMPKAHSLQALCKARPIVNKVFY